jgi:glycosyltransferase involved in cell wall biosynthesis
MTISETLVSVIVAVYQGEKYLAKAIQSALDQTHAHLEIIIIDDGSTDGTAAILQSLDDQRLRVFRQENSGAATARNLGLANAHGDYVAFLDADDYWLPRKLEEELRVLVESSDPIGIAYSWYYAVDEDGMLLNRSPRLSYTGSVFQDLLKGATFIIPSASLFHKSIFETVGNFNPHRRHHEDFALILRACRSFHAHPSERYSVLYRQSLSGKGRGVMKHYDTAIAASLSIADDLSDILTESEVEELRNSLRLALYFRFLMYGFNDHAKRLLKDIRVSDLRHGIKGWLGWFFAKSSINLMRPVRQVVQSTTKILLRYPWQRFLKKAGLSKC